MNISLQKIDYSSFFVPYRDKVDDIVIKDIIDNNDIVLILDIPNLYTHEYKLFRKSSKDFSEKSLDDNYMQEYRKLDFKDSDLLVSNYKYAPVHFLVSKINLIAMNSNAYEDTLEYNINAPLIDYLEDCVKCSNRDLLDVHIFISSENSINYSGYAEDNCVREERYNGKSYRLITFRNVGKKPVEAWRGDKKNYIVFSLWNFLKNVDYFVLENEKFYKNIMGDIKEQVCFLTMYIYIKMEWDASLENFRFKIWYDIKKLFELPNVKQDLLKEFIVEILNIIFSNRKDLVARCIRHSFANVIYSQMQYLDDVVFYSLFYKNFPKEKSSKVEMEFEYFDESPVLSVNQPVFWTMAKALKSLNSKSFVDDQLQEIKREFNKNSKDYNLGEKPSISCLLKILKVICEKYQYTNNYLYHNICAKLD